MILPELKDGMIIRCELANTNRWTSGKDYPVKNRYIYSDSNCPYSQGTNPAMQFIIVEKEPAKTIMDAVNELKGDLDNSANGYHGDESNLWHDKKNNTYGTSYGDHGVDSTWPSACTTEEFKTLISELETNSGKSITYSEYKNINARYLKQIECRKAHREKQADQAPEKPVYTQAMKDNGELPSVGMRVNYQYGINKFSPGEIRGVDGNTYWIKSDCGGFVTYVLSKLSPIDTRTDKEKAIDCLNAYNLTKYDGWQDIFIEFIKSGEFHGVKWVGE